MKIPIKHSNTKHLALIAGTVALVGGVSAPIAAYAHGGNGHHTSNRDQSRDSRHDSSRDKSRHHSNNHDRLFSWDGLSKLSAEDFANHHAKKVANLDKFVSNNNLTVENGDTLKADVNAKAEIVKTELTTLNEIRSSVADWSKATTEQRAELKTQSLATFEAYYDYKVAVSDYKTAINLSAKAAGVKDRC